MFNVTCRWQCIKCCLWKEEAE